MIRIGDEKPSDFLAREELLDTAFSVERFSKTCERLREGRQPARGLSLIAKEGDKLVGTLRFWHVQTGDGRDCLMLGPLAVASSHRAHGIGTKLMHRGLNRAAALGHKAVLLVGDAPYYAKFSFNRALAENLDLPGWYQPDRFLALELQQGALDGACGMISATGRVVDRRRTHISQQSLMGTSENTLLSR